MKSDYDAIIIGAGHNGLTSASVLARRGLKVLCLEQTDRPGGMAITRELFKGYQHNVGAWLLLLFRDDMINILGLEKYGLKLIRPRSSYCNYGRSEDRFFIGWTDRREMGRHLIKIHGWKAVIGMARMDKAFNRFRRIADRCVMRNPESFEEAVRNIPPRHRKLMKKIFYGSAIEVLETFFPNREKLNLIMGSFSASAIDGTHGNPWSPGTGLSMAYHYTMGDIYDFRTFKGGIGVLADALVSCLEDADGEIRYKSPVKGYLMNGSTVTGVELKNGEKITSRIILSSLDPDTTFRKLAPEKVLPVSFLESLKAIDYRNGYLQIHLTLSELPQYTGYLEFANEDNIRWLMAYIRSPEHLQQCYEEYIRGEVPSDPVSYMVLPSLMDPSLTSEEGYTCTIFTHYFPYNIPEGKHNEYRDLMVERIFQQIDRVAPNFRNSIRNKFVITQRYFASTFGITAGDFCHGTIHPAQWWDKRPVEGWSDYRTPLKNLYLCGSGAHPGPGVTCIPGLNGANAVLEDLGIAPITE